MRIYYNKLQFITRVSVVLLLLCPIVAEARVYLDITSAGIRKIPAAVPYFIDKQRPDMPVSDGKEMAAILGKGLKFHGFISLIDPLTYDGRHDSDWPKLGAEFIILGKYDHTSKNILLELRLVDIAEGRMVLGRRYRGAWSKRKTMALKFCDEVILKLSGERGVSLSKISFVSDVSSYKEIFIADVLGEEIREVTKHQHLAVSPRFSPDGGSLSYTSYHRGNPDLYITDLTTNIKTTRAISYRPGLNMAPSWHPDGKTMAITISNEGNPDLYLMNIKGKILRKLTSNAGINVSPSWSPDGKKLAFVSDRSGTPQIYVMNVRTKTVKRITYQGNYNTTPSWSPKGDSIAYAGSQGGVYQIFTIDPEGGQPFQVTKTWGSHESPCWAPDGRQIVLSRKRNDKKEICSIFANGLGLRPLFRMKGNQSFPQWSPRLKM
ncbi:MAG: Tol-Pal system beta propeller repeat protein TolB [Desulfobulbaceae bacterium]|nr:Tol-Pal system beta propeller repeat protein TolB [Desulfobulbaceae bacterium]